MKLLFFIALLLSAQILFAQTTPLKGIGRIRFSYIEDDQKGLLLNTNKFYKQNLVDCIETADQQTNSLVPGTKGKKVTRQGMLSALDNVLKNWDKYGRTVIMNFVIRNCLPC